jgi:hypothetical protein
MQKSNKRLSVLALIGVIFMTTGLLILGHDVTQIEIDSNAFLVSDQALWSLILMVIGTFMIWGQSIMAMNARTAEIEAYNKTIATNLT